LRTEFIIKKLFTKIAQKKGPYFLEPSSLNHVITVYAIAIAVTVTGAVPAALSAIGEIAAVPEFCQLVAKALTILSVNQSLIVYAFAAIAS
jgi:hypothetical protein